MKNLCFIFLITVLIFASGCATTSSVKEFSNPEDTAVITGIDLQDYSVGVKVNKPFTYTVYRASDPYRVVVELLNVSLGAFNTKIVSDKAGITEIVPSQVESPAFLSRLEMLLQLPSVVEPEYKDNVLTIRIKGEPPAEALALKEKEVTVEEEIEEEVEEIEEVAEAEKPELAEPIPLPKATEITSVSLERVEDILKVLIKGNGSMKPNVFPLEDRIVIDIPDVALNAQLPSAVAPPLKGIRSGIHKEKVRLVLDLKEKTDFNVTAIGDSVVIALQKAEKEPAIPPIAKKPEEKEVAVPAPVIEGKYKGKRISLDFQDADIVPIFRLLADISGYNIVVSPEVRGKLTMKLINVPWDQAMDIILKTFSLGKSVENNIIRIAPLAAFTKESEEAAKAREAEIKAEALETKTFPISYAKIPDVEKAIRDSKILTPRGSVSVDTRTSSLFVKDIPAVFPQVENLLKTIDKETPQVMIEARIVEVSTADVRDLGIQWGAFFAGTNPTVSFGGYNLLNVGMVTGRRLLVDLPATVGIGSGTGFHFGIMNTAQTRGLDLQISALERVGKSRIISNPRIVTTDNEKAIILQGTSEPYPKIDVQSGQISADFKDVVITTEVTPHITPAGSISMSVLVKKEDVIEFVPIGGNPTPRTSKIEGNTKVLIQNGETLVIGGVYKKTERETTSGVPGLMKIPILGWLFKKQKTEEDISELLIFVTPKIVEKPL